VDSLSTLPLPLASVNSYSMPQSPSSDIMSPSLASNIATVSLLLATPSSILGSSSPSSNIFHMSSVSSLSEASVLSLSTRETVSITSSIPSTHTLFSVDHSSSSIVAARTPLASVASSNAISGYITMSDISFVSVVSSPTNVAADISSASPNPMFSIHSAVPSPTISKVSFATTISSSAFGDSLSIAVTETSLSPTSALSLYIASSMVPPTTKEPTLPPTTRKPTLPPDESVDVACFITFNVTFLEKYAVPKSPDFIKLDEEIIPLLAVVYEKHIGVDYQSVTTVKFIDAKRLGIQIEYKIRISIKNKLEKDIKNMVTSVSTEYLEGKIFKTRVRFVRFLKNSFSIKDERKTVPKNEEKVVVLAEFKIESRSFSPQLENEASVEYQELKAEVERTLNRTFQAVPGFIKAIVKKFKSGSVIVDFDMIFDTKQAGKDTQEIQKRVEATFEKATADNSLGNFTVSGKLTILKVEGQASAKTSSSSTIATWVIVLIVSCVVLAVMLVLLILQWVSGKLSFHYIF